jgi:hypothetical protein
VDKKVVIDRLTNALVEVLDLFWNKKTGRWDSEWSVDLTDVKMSKLPIKFGRVESIELNSCGLTTLEGFPIKVEELIDLSNNRLTCLQGLPKSKRLDVSYNLLTDLSTMPQFTNHSYEYFNCSGNRLTSLEGSPNAIYYECYDNLLTNLDGIGDVKMLECYNNNITSLKGLPEVMWKLDCNSNNLSNLIGSPKHIIANKYKDYYAFAQGDFSVYNNPLTSLEGGPIDAQSYDCDDTDIISLKGIASAVYISCLRTYKLTSLEGLPEKIETLYYDEHHIIPNSTTVIRPNGIFKR